MFRLKWKTYVYNTIKIDRVKGEARALEKGHVLPYIHTYTCSIALTLACWKSSPTRVDYNVCMWERETKGKLQGTLQNINA